MAVSSGSLYIDALVEGTEYRWNAGRPLGTPVTITYSFMTSAPSNADADDRVGFRPLTTSQRDGARLAFSMIADVTDITFVESADSAPVNVRLGSNSQGNESAGWAYLPHSTDDGRGGQVYLNRDYDGFDDLSVGGFAFSTMIHEIGHALGLSHPGNYNAGEDTEIGTPPFLDPGDDNTYNSVMSYTELSPLQNASLMRYDIAALQYLYGANSGTNAGDDRYSFPDEAVLLTVWDGGGTDRFDFSAQGSGVLVDLTAGGQSAVGMVEVAANDGGATWVRATTNISIAYGVTIENATGSAHEDSFAGNEADNNLAGGAGADTLAGASGDDLVYGNQGNDLIYGNQGADTVFGGQGMDVLFGSRDDDAVYGNLADDTLFGGQGADALFGGQGNDRLEGNAGNDTLRGGLGADLFVFAGGGSDIILDFNGDGGDRVGLRTGQSFTLGAAADGAALIDLGNGDQLILAGYLAAAFNRDLIVAV